MKFQMRPPPLPDESAAGYLMRLFEINGAQWRSGEFEARGLKIKDVVHGDADDALRAFGVDPETLAASTARIGADATVTVTVAGETLDRDDWLTGVRRWCPKCFEDDMRDDTLPARFPGWRAHRRFWWDAARVSTCPVHEVRLERACPTCGLAPGWFGGALTACRRGHSFVSCETTTVAREHTRADAYVVGRLGGGPRIGVPFLDSLPLRQAIDVMERCGTAAIGGANAGFRNLDLSRRPEAMTAGLVIAEDWPMGFEKLLDSLAANGAASTPGWGANEVYGELVRWARRIDGVVFGKDVFDRIHAHHARRVSVPRDSAAAAFVDDVSPVHATWIAETCGVTTTTVARYLAALKIEPILQGAGLAAYARADGLHVVGILKDAIGLEGVAALLGIHATQAADLVKAGVVKPAPILALLRAPHRRYSRAEVESLVERIAGDSPIVAQAPQGLKPLCARAAAIGTGGVGAMIEAVLAGQARVRARLASQHGLRALLVDPSDFRGASGPADGDCLALKDAKKLVGVHPETALAALRVGLLVRSGTAGGGAVIARASAEAFAREFTTAAKLVGPSKRSQRAAQRRLAGAGVRPVLSKAIHPRCKTLVYRLTDIPAEILVEFRSGARGADFRPASPSAPSARTSDT